MFGNGKSSEERQRERERKKRGTRKYGQARQQHSRNGVISCVMALAALFVLAGCIFYAYLTRGETVGIVGGMAVISPVLAAWGAYLAVKGFRERERIYVFCRIGLPANFLMLIIFFAILIGGLG